jgi:hypothetical protein
MHPLDILCPHCSAYEKNPCLTSEGVPMKGFHAERKQAAKRISKLEPRSDSSPSREAGKKRAGQRGIG